jgi:hypothetical protein
MRQLILGIIGVLWGGGIVVSGIVSGMSDGAYGAGQAGAFVFGVVFLVAGARAINKHRRSNAAAF